MESLGTVFDLASLLRTFLRNRSARFSYSRAPKVTKSNTVPLAAPLAAVALALAGCHTQSQPAAQIASFREVGIIPDAPGTTARDVGFSVTFGGHHSVWIFGDTFFAAAASDGYHWRASTWSWTEDTDATDGLAMWTHALASDGKPIQLLPHTVAEQTFDDAHNGDPCPAGSACGSRHTVWPAAVVADPARSRALVFVTHEETQPGDAYGFRTVGASLAVWSSPDAPAMRPVVRPELTDPTVLFTVDEPQLGAAAVTDGETLYAYACPGGALTSPCRIARVPLAQAIERNAWRFWNGSDWVADHHTAVEICTGAPLMSVHFSEFLHAYVMFYLVPLTSHMAVRTAPRPEGPWSAAVQFGDALPAEDGHWDYGLAVHHELARDGGRIEYLSYYRPGTFLNGTVHLIEVTLR